MVISPARSSSEAAAASRAFGPRRRPAGLAPPPLPPLSPLPLPPPLPPPRLPRAAAPRSPRGRGRRVPRRPRPGGLQQAPPRRVSLLRARTHRRRGPLPAAGSPSCAAPRIHQTSRMGGDSLPLVDARGGNSLPGVTGTGGGDSPAEMTRWAGIPPSEAHRWQSVPQGKPRVLVAGFTNPSVLRGKDPGRWQFGISSWCGFGRHLCRGERARGLEVAFA